MSKAALAALDRMMSRERDREFEDEPKHVAEMKIEGDPKAVGAVADKLGLPSPDELHDTMKHDHDAEDDSGYSDGGEVEEHPVVSALRDEHPDIHAAMKRRGLC